MSLADHPNPDVRHLWAAVCAQPDEDTPRLMLADALEENGDPDRAAFVRLQIQLARNPEARAFNTWAVNDAFLRAHEAAWRRAGPCLACGGSGTRRAGGHNGNPNCAACDATGDRGGLREALPGPIGAPPVFSYQLTWERGFPSAIHAPLGDVFVRADWANNAGGWVPTPRALAWVREWPVVERVHLTCRRPYHNVAGAWIWITESNATNEMRTATLPKAVYAALTDDIDIMHRGFAKAYLTEAGAVDALARAVARVLRAALKG